MGEKERNDQSSSLALGKFSFIKSCCAYDSGSELGKKKVERGLKFDEQKVGGLFRVYF